MFLASLLRRIAFSYYDYKAYNFNIEKTEFVVIHIPDQIGDAMAIFPVIRALELHKIKHLLIVAKFTCISPSIASSGYSFCI